MRNHNVWKNVRRVTLEFYALHLFLITLAQVTLPDRLAACRILMFIQIMEYVMGSFGTKVYQVF